jgi:hypothetical protein
MLLRDWSMEVAIEVGLGGVKDGWNMLIKWGGAF